MNIDDLTIKQALASLHVMFSSHAPVTVWKSVLSCDDSAWEIGKIYLIRTVTMIDTGKLVAVTEHELVLEDAAWIANTGRFADAVRKAEFDEVEPFPDGKVIIGRGSIIDAVQIKLSPRSQK